jgi:alkylation response protein AidB-like acyl-CoA dehydrogenase
VALLDTWHVSGLRGTGSCDFTTQDVFVPIEHSHSFLDGKPSQPGLLYRMPPLSVFAWTVSVVPLGIARGAIDAFAELASRKSRAGATGLLRDRELIQATVGRAETLHGAAHALLTASMKELMEATEIDGERLVKARAMFRMACAHAAESAVGIVEVLAGSAGAAAIFETSALERAVRDVRAAAQHIAMSPNNYIVGGRLRLGLDPGTARF